MDRPLEKRQPLGPHRVIAQGHRNTLRDAEGAQRTCVLHSGQLKITRLESKVLAPLAVGPEKVATGPVERIDVRSNMLTSPDRALTRSSYLFSDQREVVAREVMHGVGDAPFPPGRVNHGHDA